MEVWEKETMTHPFDGLSGGSNYDRTNNGNGDGNGRARGKKKVEPTTLKAYKYTTHDKGLAEEVYLLSECRAKFLSICPDTCEPILRDSIIAIREIFAIIKPQDINGSNPNRSLINPYIYQDEEEIRRLIQVARRLDISDLYLLVEYIWKSVVVAKEEQLITLLTNYTLFSYFQDIFETLHYIMLTGPPGWGKGAILTTFKLLGYRVVMAGDMSGANLLDLMGTLEQCQLSLAEDELDKLDADEKKQRIYKMGYDDAAMVPRTFDAGTSNRSLKTYSPFGCKVFAGEKPPDSKALGGFNDRTFRAEAKKGKARLMVKRIKKQMERPVEKQSPKYRLIIERINFLHKILLIYRLLHQNDDILTEELPLNIYGRPLELCGPSIQLYHTLNNKSASDPSKYKIRDKVMSCLSHYLRKKGELDKKTKEGILYKILNDIFGEMDADNDKILRETRKNDYVDLDGSQNTYYVISYDEICNRFMREVDGVGLTARSFECADFGKVTHDHLISRCQEVFTGRHDSIGRDKDKRKALAFNKVNVKEVGETFEVISEIKILESEDPFEDTDEDQRLWSLLEHHQI